MDRTRKPGWTDRSTDRQQTAIVTTMSSSPDFTDVISSCPNWRYQIRWLPGQCWSLQSDWFWKIFCYCNQSRHTYNRSTAKLWWQTHTEIRCQYDRFISRLYHPSLNNSDIYLPKAGKGESRCLLLHFLTSFYKLTVNFCLLKDCFTDTTFRDIIYQTLDARVDLNNYSEIIRSFFLETIYQRLSLA